MSTNSQNNEQPDKDTLMLFHCAFPDGLHDEEYLPLLYILRKDMSIRATVSFVARLLQKDSWEIHNDALGANNKTYDQNIVENITIRLEACGYKVWLDT